MVNLVETGTEEEVRIMRMKKPRMTHPDMKPQEPWQMKVSYYHGL